MRYIIFRRGGYALDTIGVGGGETSGAVFLFRDPIGNLEAVTKQYADSSINNIHAGAFSLGTLPYATLPAFTGDITKDERTNVIKLTPTGVVPGTYTKVSVDSKGRVTAGGGLVESDIPQLPWTKVAQGLPTTLEGYGITDAILNTGGTLTGKLTLQNVGTHPQSVINKNFLDSHLGTLDSAVKTGTVLLKSTPGPHAGYLLCNGGIVDKVVYGNLYNTIGDRYGQFTHPGNGKPWVNQYNSNVDTVSEFPEFKPSTAFGDSVAGSAAAVTKDRVYVFGGRNGNVIRNTVKTSIVDKFGGLATWTAGPSLTRPRFNGEVIVTNKAIHYIGGCETADLVPTNTVYKCAITGTGVIGGFSAGTALPLAISETQVIITRNKAFMIGGRSTSGAVSSIYSTAIDSETGLLGTWILVGNLPSAIHNHKVTVVGDYVYLFGGENGGVPSSVVLRSLINSSGDLSSWSVMTSLPSAITSFDVICTRHKVFIIGNHSHPTHPSRVMMANINLDKTLGAWSFSTQVPAQILNCSAFVLKGKAYFVGGSSAGTTTLNTIFESNLLGGKNDYSEEYDRKYTSSLPDQTKFQLPEIVPDVYNAYPFVKV